MNDLVLLCLIFYIFVRIIGLGVAIDFYYDTRDRKYIKFILCWIFWILAALFPIISSIVEPTSLKELYLVLNVLFFFIGSIFYIWGFFKYFMSVPSRIMISSIALSILLIFFLYFIIDYTTAIRFSVLMIFITTVCGYVIPPLKKQNFKKFMGKSIRWYYIALSTAFIFFPLSLIISFQGFSYGLYDAENSFLIMLNYLPTISSTILLIILLVNLEYRISSGETFQLKDTYSHDLGNIMQVISSSSDLISMSASLNKQEEANLKLMQLKCKEASALIKHIRKL